MNSRVEKRGKSLLLTIPKSIASKAGLTEKCTVDIACVGGKLVASPIQREKVTLPDLVAKITAESLHGEFDTGTASGRETWQ